MNFLKNISNPTNSSPDAFLTMAGEIKEGNHLFGALKIGYYYEFQKRAPSIKHNYIEVMPDIHIDGTYSSFYGSDDSKNERFTSFSEAAKRYNEVILEQATTSEIAEQYLIHNIPRQATELVDSYVSKDDYRSSPDSCIVLHSHQSTEKPDEYTVLLYRDGKFSVAEGVTKYNNGELNLRHIKTSAFKSENLQDILDEYVSKSKCEVEYGNDKEKNNSVIRLSNTGEIIRDSNSSEQSIEIPPDIPTFTPPSIQPSKKTIEELTGDTVGLNNINSIANKLRDELTNDRNEKDK